MGFRKKNEPEAEVHDHAEEWEFPPIDVMATWFVNEVFSLRTMLSGCVVGCEECMASAKRYVEERGLTHEG